MQFKSENDNFQVWKQSKFTSDILNSKYASIIDIRQLKDLYDNQKDGITSLLGEKEGARFLEFYANLQEMQELGSDDITSKTFEISNIENRDKRAEIHQFFSSTLRSFNTQTVPENCIRVNVKNPNKK